MCGIAGIWQFNDKLVSEDQLKRFTDSMEHRGPDGSGYQLFLNSKLGLGHRRLSILDLSEAGKQPFWYLERYWIIYNGEVFNFQEIKNELELKGYLFKTSTDTEVIIAAFDCYGKKCLDLFNGMWAFAIWDIVKETLFLSRDRFGIKPLYYNSSQEQFVFASETRAFKFLDGFSRKFNEELLALEVNDPYTLEGLGYTIFDGIYQLLPGHYIELSVGNQAIQKRWWHIDDHTSKQKIISHSDFYGIFRDACKIRLISDVPVATALSGGVDSTSIYSTVSDILNNENNDRIHINSQLAVSAIFPGLDNDEKLYIDKALSFNKGSVKWIEIDYKNLEKTIEENTEMFDAISNSPITAISGIYKGMKETGITVSLDGHGVDEMMYGYLDMVYELFNEAKSTKSRDLIDEYGLILAGLYNPEITENLKNRFKNESLEFNQNFNWLKSFIKSIFSNIFNRNKKYLPVNLKPLSDKPYDFSNKKPQERILYYEFFQHTLPSLLRNFDRASMMNGVEIRMPFMDWRLVCCVFSLPVNRKIGDGFTKKILRESMKGKMSEEIRTRTHKVGVTSPIEYWFDNFLEKWLYNKVDDVPKVMQDKLRQKINSYYSGEQKTEMSLIWKQININLIN